MVAFLATQYEHSADVRCVGMHQNMTSQTFAHCYCLTNSMVAYRIGLLFEYQFWPLQRMDNQHVVACIWGDWERNPHHSKFVADTTSRGLHPLLHSDELLGPKNARLDRRLLFSEPACNGRNVQVYEKPCAWSVHTLVASVVRVNVQL